jgi:hypothetical protein
VLVSTIASLDDGTLAVVFVQIEPSLFHTGSQEIDWGGVFGALYRYDPLTLQFTIIGALGQGSVRLDEAGQTSGAAVSGRITADLVAMPF